ncbi:MAG: MaoC family dehydratase N-terminal domain-containing protein [Actinomycetales bacterium]
MTETDTRRPEWMQEWDPVIAAIGRDFAEGDVTWGADPVEPGAIRRYLEPLEFDCPLHTDPQAAAAAGLASVSMPYTGVISWTIPVAWNPGEVLFDSAERDAQPVITRINSPELGIGPRTTGFFGTDIDVDFERPVLIGERIGRRGRRLVSCVPKETGVGRGAFLTWESDVITTEGEVVARIRVGTYAYVPATDYEAGPAEPSQAASDAQQARNGGETA